MVKFGIFKENHANTNPNPKSDFREEMVWAQDYECKDLVVVLAFRLDIRFLDCSAFRVVIESCPYLITTLTLK